MEIKKSLYSKSKFVKSLLFLLVFLLLVCSSLSAVTVRSCMMDTSKYHEKVSNGNFCFLVGIIDELTITGTDPKWYSFIAVNVWMIQFLSVHHLRYQRMMLWTDGFRGIITSHIIFGVSTIMQPI
ncbi:MAG: hypothetical protein QXS02_03380 [Candidatus Thermoplasmatota archaeon]